jgi:uncharacterized cupredoxin-like copper-binding protein
MRRSLSFCVVLIVVLTACGGGSASEPAEPVALDLRMTDALAFEPGEITVAQGAEVTITATNEAPAPIKHDLIILGDVFEGLGEIKRAMEADPDIVVAELGLVEPGESDSLVVTFDEPGEYQFFCSVQGHHAAGMHGTITVEG